MNSLHRTLSLLTLAAFSQTGFSQCNDTPGQQLTVGASCSPVAFNSITNINYWDDSWYYGVCGEDDWDDAWMWFDATSTMTTITYTPTLGDPILTLFQGPCTPGDISIACKDDFGNLGAETVTIATVPGARYRVRIQRYNSNANMTGNICVFNAAISGGGGATSASDCPIAANVCTNLSFQIDPNGSGTVYEMPEPGTFSNPFNANPGGSGHMGCLQSGEFNSTWMVVNVATAGNLQFTFGGGGAQAGYFDWIMYPYSGPNTCISVMNNALAPVRCNWNSNSSGGTGLASPVPAGGNAGNFEPPLAVTAGQRFLICFSNYSNLATTVPLDFMTGPGNAGVSCTPLGFSMQGLSVDCLEGVRKLAWSAPNGTNPEKFEIQKSRNNVDWELAGTVYNGVSGEDGIAYTFIDETDPDMLTYYRVKQYSGDGETTYSTIISADCDSDRDLFRVYPNPTNGLMSLEYKSSADTELNFYDVCGKAVYTQPLERTMKSKTVQVQATEVPAGMYLYKLLVDGEVKTGTVIIQK